VLQFPERLRVRLLTNLAFGRELLHLLTQFKEFCARSASQAVARTAVEIKLLDPIADRLPRETNSCARSSGFRRIKGFHGLSRSGGYASGCLLTIGQFCRL